MLNVKHVAGPLLKLLELPFTLVLVAWGAFVTGATTDALAHPLLLFWHSCDA